MELNWNQCIICQEETSEPLKCPLESHYQSGKTDAYLSFLTNVQQFRDMDTLPTSIYFGSDAIVADFETHSASWHKSCRLKFNNSKLARAKKRSVSQVNEHDRRPSKRKAMNEKGQEEGDVYTLCQHLMLMPIFDQ